MKNFGEDAIVCNAVTMKRKKDGIKVEEKVEVSSKICRDVV